VRFRRTWGIMIINHLPSQPIRISLQVPHCKKVLIRDMPEVTRDE